jgi:hypothetical protein
MLVPSIISSLNQLVRLLEEIDSEYVTPCTLLSKSLLRAHKAYCRNVSMFDNCYDSGFVNYDNRKGTKLLKPKTAFAISQIT